MGDLLRLPRHDEPARSPEPAREPARDPAPMPMLWREAVGAELRRARHQAERTLAEVSAISGVSTPYLSEVERGRKEPSSEVLEAVAGALGLRLVDLTYRVTRRLAADMPSRPVPVGRPSGTLTLAV